MKKYFITTFLFIFFLSYVCSQDYSSIGLNSITKDELLKTVAFLSSQKLYGRLAGSNEYNKAAEYVAAEFKSYGIKPVNDNGYFQNFYVESNDIKSCKLKLYKNNKKIKNFKLGDDFVCRGFTGSGKIKAPVVFCGYGINFPEAGYDDYKNIDVKGKIVMIFRQNPLWEIKGYKWDEPYARSKADVAFRMGAKAILFVSNPNDINPKGLIGSVMESNIKQNISMPQLHISINAANEFLQGSENNLSELQAIIDNSKSPFSVCLNTFAEIDVNAKYYQKVNTMNVIGIIDGSDPVRKNEYIILGAHLDHVGGQARKIYFPGANDNASGSALVMQVAKAFAINNIKPKCSVIFILFSAEEMGMLGSKWYVQNPLVPIEKTVAMFNFDCVGHGDSILVRCGKIYPNLWNIAKKMNDKYVNMMVETTTNTSVADAEAFHNNAIPTLYFVTTNTYKHLHLTTDKSSTINADLLEKISKLAFLTAFEVASGKYLKETKP